MPKAQQSRKKKKPSPYYAVANGAEGSAIYATWAEAEPVSQGHPEAHCKGCSSAKDLIDFFGQWKVDVASVQWKSDLRPLDLSGNAPPPQPAEPEGPVTRNGGRVSNAPMHKPYSPAYLRALNAKQDDEKARRTATFFARAVPPAANGPIRPPADEGTGASHVQEVTPPARTQPDPHAPPASPPPGTQSALLSALLNLSTGSAHSLDELAAALAGPRNTTPAAPTASHRTNPTPLAGESSSSASTASHSAENPHSTHTNPPVGELNTAQLAATLRHVRDLLDGTLLALGDVPLCERASEK